MLSERFDIKDIKKQLKIWKGLESSLQKIPRDPEWNPFPAFTDFILSFKVSFLLFSGPEFSLVCQPHGADVCIPFTASIIPDIVPKT